MIEIARDKLNTALQLVRHSVGLADEFPILGCVRIGGGFVTTFDGTVATTVPLPLSDNDIDICVPFAKLASWVKNSRSKTVKISVQSGQHHVAFKAGFARVKMPIVAGWLMNNWPVAECMQPIEKEHAARLRVVSKCFGVDINTPHFLGVSCALRKGGADFIATDDVTAGTSSAGGEPIGQPFILPPRLITVLSAIKTPVDQLGTSSQFAFASAGPVMMCCLRPTADPDPGAIEALFQSFDAAKAIKLPPEFKDGVAQICAAHQDPVKKCRIDLKCGVLSVDSTDATTLFRCEWDVDSDAEWCHNINADRLLPFLGDAESIWAHNDRVFLSGDRWCVVFATMRS